MNRYYFIKKLNKPTQKQTHKKLRTLNNTNNDNQK